MKRIDPKIFETGSWRKRQAFGTAAEHLVDDAHCLETSFKRKDLKMVAECIKDIESHIKNIRKALSLDPKTVHTKDDALNPKDSSLSRDLP